ncbi:hypothetical protein [Natrinema sp. H-ect4]|uniref:hypothetical protein n=1 Tax=Natrinema sp. H-ect4 TaxID=3242699 RepID=UPI0035A87A3F
MVNDEDDHSRVKQAVDDEEAAEQSSIKINAQGLEADVEVREQEDLETVLANLEFLARREGFDTEVLSRSVQEQEDDRVEQLNGVITTVAENVQELNERVDRVEDELGGGEDSQLAEVIDRIQELEDSVHDLPEDVSRHLGELREQVTALEEYIEDVDEYATSVDDELEALRQKTQREEEQGSSETVDDENDVDEEEPDEDTAESDTTDEEEDEGEGLFRSVSSFNQLSREQRAEEVKQVIKENGPIGTSGICEKLFGYKAKSGTDTYVAVQNIMQDFRDELDKKEKDGLGVEYRFPETEDQDSTASSEPESETVNETEESEIEEPGDPSTVTEPEDLEPVEQISDDRKDFSKCQGRHTLQEIREKDELDIEAQVLKAFQEYGRISIPEATQVIFGFEASEEDEEYQAVWNQLSNHKAKEGKRVETTEREGKETLYEVFGPFKLSNLYYDSLHKLICTTCAPDPEAVFDSQKDALNHKIETKNDEVVDKHDLFVSASIPSDWHKKQKTVEQVVNRECGNQ